MNDDFLDLIEELLATEARFLIVGGYAVGAHGHPRATKDLDIWVEPSHQNASHVYSALCRFGAPLFDLKEQDLASADYGLMMGFIAATKRSHRRPRLDPPNDQFDRSN